MLTVFSFIKVPSNEKKSASFKIHRIHIRVKIHRKNRSIFTNRKKKHISVKATAVHFKLKKNVDFKSTLTFFGKFKELLVRGSEFYFSFVCLFFFL